MSRLAFDCFLDFESIGFRLHRRRPEEVAAMVVYVCSPRASATNGTALRVDGGVVRSFL